MRVGGIDLVAIRDGTALLPATRAVPGTTDRDWSPHAELLDPSGRLPVELGGYLFLAGERVVLVDAGVGPATVGPFTGGGLLETWQDTASPPAM